jgi:hypothetical protein
MSASHCVPTASAAVTANRGPTASVRPVLRDAHAGRGRTAEKERTMPNSSRTQSQATEHRCLGCGEPITSCDRQWFHTADHEQSVCEPDRLRSAQVNETRSGLRQLVLVSAHAAVGLTPSTHLRLALWVGTPNHQRPALFSMASLR